MNRILQPECRRARVSVSAAADGEETPRGILDMRRHLNECSACGNAGAGIERVAGALDRLPPVVPGRDESEQLLAALLARLETMPRPARRRRVRHLRLVVLPAAAGLALAGLGRGPGAFAARWLPDAWQVPLPPVLIEKAFEAIAMLGRRALEEIAQILLRLPELPLPSPQADLHPLLPVLFLSLLAPSVAFLAMMTHLVWDDLKACLGVGARTRR